ncbi:ATP-binding protein [Gallibacterium salpingitidis]|uniref:Schlafen AlbA-2 domain-containing protein n=1 Tax=Gallibacterium salpingitidis TaxID=505341 RepID=A0A1A7NU64_9PAST|nr:ATP-binding protein [Gallibacterium salpingitidis]OBW93051.1 hypothetical protein QS62_07790 [Gallibacterium salpingitidis]
MLSREMVLSLLQTLQQNGNEHQQIEAKKAQYIGDSIMQTVCAFANQPVGEKSYLLLGISEPDEQHNNYWVSGVDALDELLNNLHNNCRTQFNYPVPIDVGFAQVNGKSMVAVEIIGLDVHSKPCGFVGKSKKNFTKTGVWLRGINGDYEANQRDLEPFIMAKMGSSFEQHILPDSTMDDIDPNMIELYRKLRAKIRPNAPELTYSDLDLLKAFNLVKKSSTEYQPNIAGLLLFGSQAALRRLLPMARVDYIRHKGKQWVEAGEEQRFAYTQDFRESLISMVHRLEATILDDLPHHFNLEEGQIQRNDVPLLPAKVIREAVVNLLMHRDYSVNQPSQINRFSNRIEMQNAGYSLKPLEEMGSASSITRNPLIAAVLYDLQYAETKGSGVTIMRNELKSVGLTLPLFQSNQDSNQFKATFLLHQLINEEQIQWLKSITKKSLNDHEANALLIAKEMGYVDNATLREITGLDTLSASKLLQKLCKYNLLIMQGKGRDTSYLLANLYNGQLQYDGAVRYDSKPAQFDGEPAQFDGKPAQFDGKPAQFDGKPAQFDSKLIQLDTKKSNAEHIKEVILEICLEQYYSSSEISDSIRRNKNWLRTYLRTMLEQGLLNTRYDSPNHPKQAYKTSPIGIEWLEQKGKKK